MEMKMKREPIETGSIGMWKTYEPGNKIKVTLEFDEVPPLIFVQGRHHRDVRVFQNGQEVKGIRAIDIHADADELTTHRIEYYTNAVKGQGSSNP